MRAHPYDVTFRRADGVEQPFRVFAYNASDAVTEGCVIAASLLGDEGLKLVSVAPPPEAVAAAVDDLVAASRRLAEAMAIPTKKKV